MDEIGIEIGRHWEHDSYDEGWISASNGVSQSKMDIFWEGDHLTKMGKAFTRFSRKIPSQYSHEIRDSDGFYYLVFHAHINDPNHLFLEIRMNTRTEEERRVSFKVDPSAIHRLGELLLAFSKEERTGFKYSVLRWSPNSNNDALVEFELPKLDPALAEWERLKRKHPLQGETPKKEPLNLDNEASVEFEFHEQGLSKVERLQMDPALKEWERLKRKHPLGGNPKRKKPWWKSLWKSLWKYLSEPAGPFERHDY